MTRPPIFLLYKSGRKASSQRRLAKENAADQFCNKTFVTKLNLFSRIIFKLSLNYYFVFNEKLVTGHPATNK